MVRLGRVGFKGWVGLDRSGLEGLVGLGRVGLGILVWGKWCTSACLGLVWLGGEG